MIQREKSSTKTKMDCREDKLVEDGLRPVPRSPVSGVVEIRQVNVIIGSNPSETISSLSSALVTAQQAISSLSKSVQDLQLASVSAAASAQAAAQASLQASAGGAASVAASSLLASVSSSAAAELAEISSSAAAAVSSLSSSAAAANARADEASRSADAARADASIVRVSQSKCRSDCVRSC